MKRKSKHKAVCGSPSAASMAESAFFKPGTAVEVSSEDDGFRGSWYSGTIIRRLACDRFLVEYDNLMADEESSKQLREVLGLRYLRPLPPMEIGRELKFGDEVDAYHNEGWWEGHITQELENGTFAVYFRASREQMVFPKDQLRLHREWFNQTWVPPVQQPTQPAGTAVSPVQQPIQPARTTGAGESKKEMLAPNVKKSVETVKVREDGLKAGDLVEVSSDEDGFSGAWFSAIVVEVKGKDKFVVEYQSLLDDDSSLLKEEIDVLHIRPHPPEASVVGLFNLLDEVDALYNDGWWVGVIAKILPDSKYVVYFRSSNEELEFEHSQLRLHQDWINGKWVMLSKVLKL